jgi:O-antigen ligase
MLLKLSDPLERTITGLLIGLVLLSPLLYIGVLHDPAGPSRYALLALVVCTSFIIYAVFAWRRQLQFRLPLAMTVASLFLAWAAASTLWSVELGTHYVYLVQLLSLILLFFIAIQIASATTITAILYISVFAASIAALIGILQDFDIQVLGIRSLPMGSTFAFKNHAALYFDLILPASLILVIIARHKLLRWISALALAVCLGFILDTHTRGSLLAGGVAIMLFIAACTIFSPIRATVMQGIQINKFPLLAALVVAIVIYVMPGANDSTLDRPHYASDKIDTSTRDRLTAYTNSFELIKEHPIVGVGYGAFWKAFRPYTNHPNIIQRSDLSLYFFRLHNDPLQLLVELGIVGIGLFTLMFFLVYRDGIKCLSSSGNGDNKLLVLALLLGISASLMHSFVDFPMLKPSSVIQLWLFAGLVVGQYFGISSRALYPLSSLVRLSLAVVSPILAILFTIYYVAFLKENYYLYRAEEYLKENNCPQALQAIDRSVDAFRLNFFSHRYRVSFHVQCNKDIQSLFETLSEELQWDNSNPEALVVRGEILLKSGFSQQALQDFQRVTFLVPHQIDGPLWEAQTLIAQGKLSDAEMSLQNIATRFPDNAKLKRVTEKLIEAKHKDTKTGIR